MFENTELPGACNWYVENDMGWFVAYSINVLCLYDMRTKMLSGVSAIPTLKAEAFQNPLCIKYKDRIYCIPNYRNSIWYYDLNSRQWDEILLCNDENTEIMACLLGKQGDIYYFFSMVLKKIWGLNLETGKITDSCNIHIEKQADVYFCMGGILIGNRAYLVLGGNSVYEIDLCTHIQKKYDLPEVDDTLYRIGYDGKVFWLIGRKKDVYLWNQEKNVINILTQYPDDFAAYDFAERKETDDFENVGQNLFVFSNIYCLGEKVWLIPQSGNKIMYCDKNDRKMRNFNILDEEETAETLDLNYRHIATKFFMMYVREERYLGIYSYKNKRMFEIDTQNMNYKNIDIKMDDKSLADIQVQNFYEDGNEATYLIYNAKIANPERVADSCDGGTVGAQIYRAVK